MLQSHLKRHYKYLWYVFFVLHVFFFYFSFALFFFTEYFVKLFYGSSKQSFTHFIKILLSFFGGFGDLIWFLVWVCLWREEIFPTLVDFLLIITNYFLNALTNRGKQLFDSDFKCSCILRIFFKYKFFYFKLFYFAF